MTRARASEAAPRFLSDPCGVIVEAATAVDAALDRALLEQTILKVADTRPKRRRLAQALHDDPGLLLSGRPAGPRLVEELIDALQDEGGHGFVRPRCAHCHEQQRLLHVDPITELRICVTCSVRSRTCFDDCSACGERRRVDARDHQGRALCRPCRNAGHRENPLEAVHQHLLALNTGLDDQELRDIACKVLERPFQQLRMAQELDAAPRRLLEDPARGSYRLVLLAEALHDHGAHAIARPACSVCHTDTRRLRFVRDGRRCCRACYDQPRRETCARCGRITNVVVRTPQGHPLCGTCTKDDPVNHEECAGCGRSRPVVHRDEEARGWCSRCWRGTPTTCAFCAQHKPCRTTADDLARCDHCARKQRPASPCFQCGKSRPISRRTPDGQPLCNNCSPRPAHCARCGQLRRVQARTPEGGLCRPCYRKSQHAVQTCTSCGRRENLHHFGLCLQCSAAAALRASLGTDDDVPEQVKPVFDALVTQDPFRLMVWLERSSAADVVRKLVSAASPVTHELLDDHLPDQAIQFLRAALVNTDVLPPRDEQLAILERWLEEFLAAVAEPIDRQLLQQFATWHYIRRLRARSGPQRPTTPEQIHHVRNALHRGRELLNWLQTRDRPLATCTQEDIDLFLVDGPAGGRGARPLLKWASAHHYAPRDVAIAYPARTPPHDFIADDERWAQTRKLLHDEDVPPADRLAGLLLLLLGQPASRITHLKVHDIEQHRGTTRIRLGPTALTLPPPTDRLAHEVLATRRGYSRLGHRDEHPWLFPGGRPGQPLSRPQLGRRLKKHGVRPRPARNAVLLDLAAQVPAAVLGQLLGLDPTTAGNWTRYAASRSSLYARHVSQRLL